MEIAQLIEFTGPFGPDSRAILEEGQAILDGILENKLVIAQEVAEVTNLLLQKNRAYGSSVFNPMGIFVKGVNATLAVDVRIEDKLARIKQATDFSEDTELDLIGYLILKRLVARRAKEKRDLERQPELPGYRVGELHPSVMEHRPECPMSHNEPVCTCPTRPLPGLTDVDGYDPER